MSAKREHRQLEKRAQDILMHGKTDMITPLMVFRRYFADATIEAARSAIRRLCDNHYIRPEPLDQQRVYYPLTRLGTKLIGVSPKYAQSLKKSGKIKRYALSWFIHADQPGKRLLFNPHDFADQFGIRGQSLPRHPFFIDETSGQSRLGMALVDHNGHPRRIVQKTIKPLARFLSRGWFDDFIRQDSFLVALLTFNSGRQKAFRQQLPLEIRDRLGYPLSRLCPDFPNHIPVATEVHVIPGLLPLVMPTSQKETEQ